MSVGSSGEPVSETAAQVKHYFQSGELLRLAMQSSHPMRVLHYEERREWDTTHGPAHGHGKAIALMTHADHYPDWYGKSEEFRGPVRR